MICRPLPSRVHDWIAPRERPARSAGWHVSTVLVAMLKAMGTRRYESWGKRTEDRKPTDELGYMWEDVLSAPLANRSILEDGEILLPPCELELDDIYGTPDRPIFSVPRRRFINEEVKATWMTGKGVLAPETYAPMVDFQTDSKFAYWRLQTMTYAAMILFGKWPASWRELLPPDDEMFASRLETGPLPPLGRIRALFLNGCYKGELALPGAWELEWTPEELERWWAGVVKFARAHPELQTPGEEEPVS